MALLVTLAGLLASAAVVVFAGVILARSGDVIAARTGLGGLWTGSVFLAMATSLPEITTDISAVRMGVPDLAVGDLFGSSMANMLILALVSFAPGAELFRRAALENTLYAALALLLTAMAAITLLARPSWSILGIGPGSAAILAAYLVASRAIFRHSALARAAVAVVETAPPDEKGQPSPAPLRSSVLRFAGGCALILTAAPVFARSAGALAELTGIHASFIGTWLVGLSTSLPELVTSWAAVRLRAYDLAVGNLFGSNAVNMAMFPLLDLVSAEGPVLSTVHPVHAVSALAAIGLMAIGLAGIVYRAERRVSLQEPSGLVMVLGYFAGLAAVFATVRTP